MMMVMIHIFSEYKKMKKSARNTLPFTITIKSRVILLGYCFNENLNLRGLPDI